MSICSSNVTSGFIDQATYDELEKYMYGGLKSRSYFVRDIAKSTWFSQIPIVLSNCSGQKDLNQDFSVSITRSGDYLLHNWLRVKLPEISIALTTTFTNPY